VKQLLDAIFELIRLVLAHVLEPRPVMAERRICIARFEHRIVDAVELEREEQQMHRGRSAAPARRRRIWCAPDRPCRRHAPDRHRSRAAREIVDRLITRTASGKRGAGLRPRARSASLPL
jgi:hypothetical protein